MPAWISTSSSHRTLQKAPKSLSRGRIDQESKAGHAVREIWIAHGVLPVVSTLPVPSDRQIETGLV